MAKRPSVTVALDLGSTFCGYAYSIDNGDIHLNRPWRPQHGFDHWKTPTALLYSENGELEHIGFDTIPNVSGQRGRQFYRYFKKKADDSQIFRFSDTFLNQSGEAKNRLDLHADVLRKLKDRCLDELAEIQGDTTTQMHDIMWILSVPMVWAIQEKEFMVAAAFQAGLITELKSTNIMVILEGDASYSFCSSLDPRVDLEQRLASKQIERLNKSKGILVVDLGGMTVDTTFKEVSPGGNNSFVPSERRVPSGLRAGGEGVNQAFEDKLKDILGEPFILEMKREHLPSWLVFMNEFEIQKKNHSKGTDYITLGNVQTLVEVYQQSRSRKLADVLDEFNMGMNIHEEHGWLRLNKKLMNELYDATVTSITEHIADKVRDEDEIQVIYLTGGFASSKYLQERVADAVGDRALVVIPKNPEQSVLKGAIHYSRANQNLSIHNITANYGIATKEYVESPDKDLHPHILEKGKKVLEGRVYESVVYRDELEVDNELPIYNNKNYNFFTFRLSDIRHPPKEATVRVQLQFVERKSPTPVLQAMVTDEITRECFIKRKEITNPSRWQNILQTFLSIAVLLFCIYIALISGVKKTTNSTAT